MEQEVESKPIEKKSTPEEEAVEYDEDGGTYTKLGPLLFISRGLPSFLFFLFRSFIVFVIRSIEIYLVFDIVLPKKW